MRIRADRQGLPTLGDSPETLEAAKKLSEVLRYYSELFDDPSSTALEVYGFNDGDISSLFEEVYRKLITQNASIHERLRAIDFEVTIPENL